jgi:hypothetical protein
MRHDPTSGSAQRSAPERFETKSRDEEPAIDINAKYWRTNVMLSSTSRSAAHEY